MLNKKKPIMSTLENGQPDTTKIERDAITDWLNSFKFPTAPTVEDAESKKIVKAIEKKFAEALVFAAKKNNLPF